MREKYTACAGIIQSAITSSKTAAGSFYGHFSERFIATRDARRTAMRGRDTAQARAGSVSRCVMCGSCVTGKKPACK